MVSDVEVQKRHLSGWARRTSSSSLLSLSCVEVAVGTLACSSLHGFVCFRIDFEASGSTDRSIRFSRFGVPTRLWYESKEIGCSSATFRCMLKTCHGSRICSRREALLSKLAEHVLQRNVAPTMLEALFVLRAVVAVSLM